MAYTNIDDPSAYFQTAIWTGNGGSDRAIVNDGNSAMQPDWVWYKSRSHATSNILYDSSRGADYYLKSNTNGAEGSDAQMFESFDSDGFSLNGDTDGNGSGRTYVAWQWKANGGTTATNTTGSIDSVVQANTDAGFSIVTYTGGGSAGTIGHGLGVKPDVIILKKRNGAVHWYVRHVSTGSSYLVLSLTAAAASNPGPTWTTTEPTSSVFSIGSGADFNANGGTFLAYCFAEKQGYSKFGSYVGNGSADGPFIYTGFRPAFVMVKKASAAGGGWFMQDIKRGIKNSASGTALIANTTNTEAEIGTTNYEIDFLSGGFKFAMSNQYINSNGVTFVYMAFAEHPFVTSTGIPTTAR